MGYNPFKITYASDYFDNIYNFAKVLISKGKAFICEQSKEEIHDFRRKKLPSPYRNRDIKESLDLFERMKNGEFSEGI